MAPAKFETPDIDLRDVTTRRRELAERQAARRQDADEHAAETAEWRYQESIFDLDERSAMAEHAAAEREHRRELVRVAEDVAAKCRHNVREKLAQSIRLSGNDRGQARAEALHSHQRAAQWDAMAKELRSSVVQVHEPDVYSRTSPHSWFADLAAIANPITDPQRQTEARDRLERYSRHLVLEGRDLTPEGRYIRRCFREKARKPEDMASESRAEYRAMTTGGSSGGTFVTPYYAVEDYAVYRALTPSFLERAVTRRPLPEFGMQVNVPAFTGPSQVGTMTENTTAPETDPTGAYRQAPVVPYVGVVTGSQQLLDRAGPLGADSVIYAQLREQFDAAVDLAAITAALTGVTALTRATFSIAGLLSDIGHMAATLETTAGVALPPQALVTTPVLGEWLMSQVGSDNRPVFMPAPGPSTRTEGFLGYSPSGIGLYADGTIPAVGSNAQMVMAGQGATFVYLGDPITDVLPDGAVAANLSVVFRLRGYAAMNQRYPAGVAAATGAAYPTAVTWA